MGSGVFLVLLPPDLLSPRWGLKRSGAELFSCAPPSADVRSGAGHSPGLVLGTDASTGPWPRRDAIGGLVLESKLSRRFFPVPLH